MTAAEPKTFMEYSLHFAATYHRANPDATQSLGVSSALALAEPWRYKWSDLQAFGDCTQSSQIGPHLVQPLRARPSASTLKISINRLNMVDPLPAPRILRPQVRHFQAAPNQYPFR